MLIRSSALEFRALPGRVSADPFEGVDAGRLSMRVVRLEAGAQRRPHRHPISAEAMYVVEGTGHFWENGQVRRVKAGDCVLVRPGVAHATVPDQDAAMELVCFLPHPDLASNTEELEEVIRIQGPTDG